MTPEERKRAIVEDFFRSGEIQRMAGYFRFHTDCERNIALRDEFIQETVMILLNYRDPMKIIQLHERGDGHLRRFTGKIMKNIKNNVTSKWFYHISRWERVRTTLKDGDRRICD